jgi:SUF system NifU family Fe-S assembly protein
MSDLHGLYQEVILDHSKRPHNYRVMEGADYHADGYNPLCGDRVRIYLKLKGDRISDISFQGSGCAISTASASILTETLKGKTPAELCSKPSTIWLPVRVRRVESVLSWKSWWSFPVSRSFRPA